jgi:hypothetical protein
MKQGIVRRWIGILMLAALTACGGGGGTDESAGTGGTSASGSNTGGTGAGSTGATTSSVGTLRLSLTDSPACGYDNAWVTVEKVRVHASGTAGDGDAGWHEVTLSPPLRIDLLTLTNGTLVPLGQTELPAGSYTQLRLVIADDAAVTPTGGSLTPLKTPSAQQSGLKLNVQMTVPAGEVADFAIDFDACKSFHTTGNGKIMLKPVLAVLPILSPAGQRIQGWLDPSLPIAGTTVSVQAGGEIVRATPPLADGSGKFVLYPVPLGTYDLVITSAGRVTAIVTGVPSKQDSSTIVNSMPYPVNPPVSARLAVSGQVSVGLSTVDTGGFVRALQTVGLGPTVEVASDNAGPDDGLYGMLLPTGLPIVAPYVEGAVRLDFVPALGSAGRYLLSATVARSPEVKTAEVVFDIDPVVQDFHFELP